MPSIRPFSQDNVLTLMQALFIGQAYIDVTFLTDRMPTGDEKHVASAYAISFGGNAVTAAFCCAKLGLVPELLATVADDWLGRMFLDMAAKYGIAIHPRKVRTSSLSFVMPNDGKPAIVRCRDDDFLDPFPEYAYDRDTSFGRLDKALDAAAVNHWVVADMKNDWKRVFAFE